MRAVMRLVEVDAALARLGAEQDRIGDALVELDGHFGRKLLDGAALTGTTKDRWRAARERISLLWTAPCDLTEATTAVASYQRAVTDAVA